MIKIATSQFPVSSDILRNKAFILQQLSEAKQRGCDLVHFPECALSGYAGVDMESLHNYDWELLKACTIEILRYCRALKTWAILGSTHPLSGNNKPHNSLYIIDSEGEIVDRYDKMFCAGDETEAGGDLAHYTPGNHFSIFRINSITCATLICHDYRYPELYRNLKKQGVEVVFHSYHAGNMTEERRLQMEAEVGEEFFPLNSGRTFPEITMPATMISYAANNYMWISCSNTSASESCFGAFMVRPDGVTVGKLQKSEPGILTTEIDTGKSYYDSTKSWRARAIEGVYHSGRLVNDNRSEDRKSL